MTDHYAACMEQGPASNCRHNVRRHILAKTVFLAHLRARSCEHVGRLFRDQDASLLGIARVHFYHNADVSNSPLSHLFNIYCVRRKKKNSWQGKSKKLFLNALDIYQAVKGHKIEESVNLNLFITNKVSRSSCLCRSCPAHSACSPPPPAINWNTTLCY